MNETLSAQPESFEAFFKSFSYGSRTDLSFKFLSHLSSKDASNFFQEIFQVAINSLDQKNPALLQQVILKWQIKAYDSPAQFIYDDGPFTPMAKPLSTATIGLLSSSGHFLKDRDPNPFGVKNLTQQEAIDRIMDFIKLEPELSEIPFNSKKEDLKVRHGGYDISAAKLDSNSVFPYELLKEFAENGKVGRVSANAYSFVGACSQFKLQKQSIPKWIEIFKAAELDALILTPV